MSPADTMDDEVFPPYDPPPAKEPPSLLPELFSVLAMLWLPLLLLFDPDDTTQRFPYQFRHHLSDLKRNLNPAFGYWALGDSATIQTRQRLVAGEGALTSLIGTGALRAVYVPDFSGSNPLPIGGEFDDWAVMILTEMLVANRTAPAKK